MRNHFAKVMVDLAKQDDRVVLLSGDIGNRLFDNLKDVAPDRVINCGIAEQNMMSVAAGMGMNGLLPVVYTITPFTTYRCLEQIRVGACYHESPVIIVGTGSGMSYTSLGPTHHSMEDMAVLRTLPGMQVIAPADSVELELALKSAMQSGKPTYIRIGKKGEPILHETIPQFSIGKSINLKQGTDVAMLATGVVVSEAIKAAEELESRGISVSVDSFHTIKPLDVERLENIFSSFKTVAVVEEHGKIGGLYGAISEWALESKVNQKNSTLPRVLSFGGKDTFLHAVGTQAFARKYFGFDSQSIIQKICEELA